MKKLFLTSLLAVFSVSAANAANSYFVGGSASIQTDNNHATILEVSPEFGWKLNSDWDLGVLVSFGLDHDNYLPANFGVDGDVYSYGIGAFARYKVAQFGGVKLLLKGSAGIESLTLDPDVDGVDSETVQKLGAFIIPMITYDISESFTLYANLNFLGVYADYNFKNKELGIDESWRFVAGVDADNIANTSDFQIGFTYNF